MSVLHHVAVQQVGRGSVGIIDVAVFRLLEPFHQVAVFGLEFLNQRL